MRLLCYVTPVLCHPTPLLSWCDTAFAVLIKILLCAHLYLCLPGTLLCLLVYMQFWLSYSCSICLTLLHCSWWLGPGRPWPEGITDTHKTKIASRDRKRPAVRLKDQEAQTNSMFRNEGIVAALQTTDSSRIARWLSCTLCSTGEYLQWVTTWCFSWIGHCPRDVLVPSVSWLLSRVLHAGNTLESRIPSLFPTCLLWDVCHPVTQMVITSGKPNHLGKQSTSLLNAPPHVYVLQDYGVPNYVPQLEGHLICATENQTWVTWMIRVSDLWQWLRHINSFTCTRIPPHMFTCRRNCTQDTVTRWQTQMMSVTPPTCTFLFLNQQAVAAWSYHLNMAKHTMDMTKWGPFSKMFPKSLQLLKRNLGMVK